MVTADEVVLRAERLIDNVYPTLQGLRELADRAAGQLRVAEQRLAESQQEVGKLKDQLQERDLAHKREHEQRLAAEADCREWAQKAATTQALFKSLQEKLESEQKTVQAAKAVSAALVNERDMLQADYDDLTRKYEQNAPQGLLGKIDDLQAEVVTLQAKCRDRQQEIDKLTPQLAALQDKVIDWQAIADKRDRDIAAWQANSRELQIDLRKAEQRLAETKQALAARIRERDLALEQKAYWQQVGKDQQTTIMRLTGQEHAEQQLRQQNGWDWCPLTRALPEGGLFVLVAVHNRDPVLTAHYTYHLASWEKEGDRLVWWDDQAGKELKRVTHWAYLPPTPEAQGDG